MKILHIVEDFSLKSGGLRTVVKSLSSNLNKLGYQSFILSSDCEIEDNIFLVKAKNKWLYSKEWGIKLKEILHQYGINIIHIHGVWLYPQYLGSKYAIRNKIPMVVSAHGMYQPWLWKKNTLVKTLYFNFLVKKWFSKASCIHSITDEETENLRKLFKSNQFIEIPNLISFDDEEQFLDIRKESILYLGRLNETKGIDILIKAFSKIENKSIKLQIAGGINSYKNTLEKLAESFEINERVEYLGEVKGTSKVNLIKKAWIMASPTHSDVIGMVNLEAASLKTPMITTHATGLKQEWNINGGKLINPNEKELVIALNEALSWSLNERLAKGAQLFSYAKQHYSWSERLKDWDSLYKKLKKNE